MNISNALNSCCTGEVRLGVGGCERPNKWAMGSGEGLLQAKSSTYNSEVNF